VSQETCHKPWSRAIASDGVRRCEQTAVPARRSERSAVFAVTCHVRREVFGMNTVSPTTAWSAGLVAAVVGGCLIVGCLEPLVAVAVIAAGALPPIRAVLLVLATWAAGQAVGFGLHDYPRDVQTLAWGLGLAAGGLVALTVATAVLWLLKGRPTWLRAAAAFAAAFCAHQAAMLGVEQIVAGSCEIRPGIIAQVGLINAAWFLGLLALDAVITRRAPSLPAFGRAA
jgi:hypothetical protein